MRLSLLSCSSFADACKSGLVSEWHLFEEVVLIQPLIQSIIVFSKSQQSFIENGGAFATVYRSFFSFPNLSIYLPSPVSFPRNLNAVGLSFSFDEE